MAHKISNVINQGDTSIVILTHPLKYSQIQVFTANVVKQMLLAPLKPMAVPSALSLHMHYTKVVCLQLIIIISTMQFSRQQSTLQIRPQM